MPTAGGQLAVIAAGAVFGLAMLRGGDMPVHVPLCIGLSRRAGAAALAAFFALLVRLPVTDEGIGVDPARLEERFKQFRQIDPGLDRANGGLGLGLTMVRQLVEMHDGCVWAHSGGLGTGCTLTVRLPLYTPADADGPAAVRAG